MVGILDFPFLGGTPPFFHKGELLVSFRECNCWIVGLVFRCLGLPSTPNNSSMMLQELDFAGELRSMDSMVRSIRLSSGTD